MLVRGFVARSRANHVALSAVRKFLLLLQAGFQCAHENWIFRFRYSVPLDDVTFAKESKARSFLMRTYRMSPTSRPIQTANSASVFSI